MREDTESIKNDGYVRAEIYTRAFKICRYLLLKYLEKSAVELGVSAIFQKPGLDFLGSRPWQMRPAEAGVSPSQAKVAPFCLKNHIFYHFSHFFA